MRERRGTKKKNEAKREMKERIKRIKYVEE